MGETMNSHLNMALAQARQADLRRSAATPRKADLRRFAATPRPSDPSDEVVSPERLLRLGSRVLILRRPLRTAEQPGRPV
jgi:hypothetical protein